MPWSAPHGTYIKCMQICQPQKIKFMQLFAYELSYGKGGLHHPNIRQTMNICLLSVHEVSISLFQVCSGFAFLNTKGCSPENPVYSSKPGTNQEQTKVNFTQTWCKPKLTGSSDANRPNLDTVSLVRSPPVQTRCKPGANLSCPGAARATAR